MAQGKAAGADMMLQLVGEIREFEMPRPIFTSTEKAEWSSGQIDNAHIALQARTDLMKVIETSRVPGRRGRGSRRAGPFLRDTLVGLNYAYFEPPGDQMLHNNPLFVRSHDFSGELTLGGGQSWRTPALFGAGEPAGGGAHLAGSLADLPYVLAKSDQNFVVPENVQALVWDEMVPSLLTERVVAALVGNQPQRASCRGSLPANRRRDSVHRRRRRNRSGSARSEIFSDRVPRKGSAASRASLLAGRSGEPWPP